MNFWRRSKRAKAFLQPSLPGLFQKQTTDRSSVRRLATAGEQALNVARGRISIVAIMFALAYLLIVGRLVDLTLLNEPPDIASTSSPSGETSITSRADITDRNGTLLATSLPTVSLCANGRRMIDTDDAAKKLGTVLPEIDTEKLRNDLRVSKHCINVKRHLTPKQSYAINKLGIAGLEFIPDERRIYPAGNLTAHVLGYTDIDNAGLAGVEKFLDARLQQEPAPVALSIDLRIQTVLHRELTNAIAEYHALAGTGVIMDVTNGEIVALVSLPDFDPHRPGTADQDAKFNRSTLGVYEMGSTFKVFNTALAMENGNIKPSDIFDTTHPIEVGHQTIKDFHPEPHDLNVVEILMKSSNLGSARMAEKVGGARQRAFLTRLGLTDKASLEIPEVGAPLVPSASNWGEATTLTVSYGHGIAVSEIQLAAAVASIANDGIRVFPTLLKGGSQVNPNNRVVSSRTSTLVRAMMRLVASHGTGKKADVQGYLVAAKTGTADKVSGKKYAENSRRASVVSVFPANAPRYLVLAMLDDPKGTPQTHNYANAGWNAAPTVGRIIAQAGPMLGVVPLQVDAAALAEQQLMRQLGNEVLDRLQINTGDNDATGDADNDQ